MGHNSTRRGAVSEWSMEHAWKVCIRQRIVGSNPTHSARFFPSMSLAPTLDELAHRDAVVASILACIRSSETIHLPRYDPSLSRASDLYALQFVGIEPNRFGGEFGAYRYQFEGEDDLLHLFVSRPDGNAMSSAEAHAVVSLLYGPVPKALIWYHPAEFSHHFYLGHDVLLEYLV